MEMPIGEVSDRFTIVVQKFIHGRKFGPVPELRAELAQLLSALSSNPGFAQRLVDLLEANVRIWWLETDLRNGREGGISLEDVGRRALEIRDVNKERIAAKNAIAAYSRDDRFEVKIDHASS